MRDKEVVLLVVAPIFCDYKIVRSLGPRASLSAEVHGICLSTEDERNGFLAFAVAI